MNTPGPGHVAGVLCVALAVLGLSRAGGSFAGGADTEPEGVASTTAEEVDGDRARDPRRGVATRTAAPLPSDGEPLDAAAPEPTSPIATGPSEWELRERLLLERIDELEEELATERDLRRARELEWLEFTRAIAELDVSTTPVAPGFLEIEGADGGEESDDAEPPVEPPIDPAVARSGEVLRDLNALLMIEQVLALDVLEVGRVEGDAVGPIIVRLVDDWGRPSGTLVAERLKLECSRAGRTVTLVFEEGYESRGGIAQPFGPPSEPDSKRGGVRRIHLPGVDPEPWIEAFPELLGGAAEETLPDDGLWDPFLVKTKLNDLLRDDATGGHWRLRSLAGVVGDSLRQVHLVQLDENGRVERRVFADHLWILADGEGVLLRLEDGVQERGGRRAPFLEGRYRIYLPRARFERWRAAGLPGLEAETVLSPAELPVEPTDH